MRSAIQLGFFRSTNTTLQLLWLAGAMWILPFDAAAQVTLPPVNLGTTSFEDGIAFPGWLIEEMPNYYRATDWRGSHGNTIPGTNSVNVISSMTHVAYISKLRVLGGYYAAEILAPIADVHLRTEFGSAGRAAGAGDVIVGPFAIQWTDAKLFGRPLLQRVMVDVATPTGTYNRLRSVNVGSNVVSINPYYAFTFAATEKLEFSGRLHYLWNSTNSDVPAGRGVQSVQPGQALHQNFAASYRAGRPIRIGINCYALEQITDHSLNGARLPNSRERVVAIGPGVQLRTMGFFLYLNAYFETAARNRPQGASYVVRVAKVIGSTAHKE